MTEQDMILAGIVGSTAYGLAHADSDIDMLGVFQTPTREFLGLNTPKESRIGHDPDWQAHELGKFVHLCLSCNPTVTEMLWLPEDMYAVITPTGQRLIDMRERFLSQRAFYSFGGYANEQFRRLKKDGNFSSDKRSEDKTRKHARHLARLIIQGTGLLLTGKLVVRLSPDQVSFCSSIAEAAARESFGELDIVLEAYQTLKEESVLPEQPDKEFISDFLVEMRLGNL